MTPTTPYLLRAIYEWCVDNGFTPYIAVRVNEHTRVPMEHVRNGEIVLNVSADATRNLTMGNDLIQFSARFSGVSRELSIPIEAVTGIFAKENGQGIAFPENQAAEAGANANDESTPAVPDSEDKPPPPPTGGKPRLQVVK
ncbi:MAG: ClpXP protease specificity-enhancing factor [Burkholderiales bacterium]